MDLLKTEIDVSDICKYWYPDKDRNETELSVLRYIKNLIDDGIKTGELPIIDSPAGEKEFKTHAFVKVDNPQPIGSNLFTTSINPDIAKDRRYDFGNPHIVDVLIQKVYRTDLIKFLDSKNEQPPEGSILLKWFSLDPDYQAKIQDISNDSLNDDNSDNKLKVIDKFSNIKELRAKEITLLINYETAKFKARNITAKVSPKHLGFKSNSLGWLLLNMAASEKTHNLTFANSKLGKQKAKDNTTALSVRISRLRNALIEALGIVDDPILCSADNNYVLAFKEIIVLVDGDHKSKLPSYNEKSHGSRISATNLGNSISSKGGNRYEEEVEYMEEMEYMQSMKYKKFMEDTEDTENTENTENSEDDEENSD